MCSKTDTNREMSFSKNEDQPHESENRLDMKYDIVYLSTAIGLKPGGSSTVHIYTQTIHRTTQ